MMAANIIVSNGSITKNESLNRIDYNILENTCVAENVDAYRDYYGSLPNKSGPNSLFLFTRKFYPLDVLHAINCDIKQFLQSDIELDIATAILDFTDHYHYAVRIRDFPDYKYIKTLQTCYEANGIVFSRKIHMNNSSQVTVFKLLELEVVDDGIFLDKKQNHKGYVLIPNKISLDDLTELSTDVRNNQDCEIFDAAIGTFEFNAKTNNMIRIYSENMSIKMLECIKKTFTTVLEKKYETVH